MEQIHLERLRVGAKAALPRYVAESAEATSYLDHQLDSLVYALRSEVLGHKQAEDTVTDTATLSVTASVEVPTSTWQMFKRTHQGSWWLGWMVRRRPVRVSTVSKTETKTATLTATWKGYAKFPDAAVRYPDSLGSPVMVSYVDHGISYRRDAE